MTAVGTSGAWAAPRWAKALPGSGGAWWRRLGWPGACAPPETTGAKTLGSVAMLVAETVPAGVAVDAVTLDGGTAGPAAVIITGTGAGLIGVEFEGAAPRAGGPCRAALTLAEAVAGRTSGACAVASPWPATGLAGADNMLGGARRLRDPLALVGALGGAETRRADVFGGVSGFGLRVFGPSSRGGTLGSGTPRPVRFEGGPERRAGKAGGRDRASAARGASTALASVIEAGSAGRDRLGGLGAAPLGGVTFGGVTFGATEGLFGAGSGARGAELPAGRDGSGTGGGSSPATS